jgi:hypothetical protein
MAKRSEMEDCSIIMNSPRTDRWIAMLAPVGFYCVTILAKYFEKLISFPAQD